MIYVKVYVNSLQSSKKQTSDTHRKKELKPQDLASFFSMLFSTEITYKKNTTQAQKD